ncbi:MAG: dihydroorotase [Paramuribaculum sp.]|nr:dihydroorotase [Paramuribaculum sp.]
MKAGKKTLIHNVRITDDGTTIRGYVLIEDEFILAKEEGNVSPQLISECHTVIDGQGKLLIPGGIDEHVHFRQPGLTHKADIASESRAAVAGGITSFIDMPNTNPATVTVEALENKLTLAAQSSVANYGFFLGATNDNIEELKKADPRKTAGIKLFIGSSTGNMLVDKSSTIRRILEEIDMLVAVHAEDEHTIQAKRAAVIERYGENLPIDFHPVIRSHEACYKATEGIVALAKETGARLHVLHISTADELRLFTPGPIEGKRITSETCPQYLLFTDELYASLGARIKCNPAIKRPVDRDALRYAVANGLIDVIATDHAPHLLEEKKGTALTAVSGMPMIQFSHPAMIELAKEGVLTMEQVVEKMSNNPARLFRIDRRGFIRPGYYADLVLVDDDCDPYPVTPEMVLSKCRWSPLEGAPLTVKIDMTWVNGHLLNSYGIILDTPKALPLRFNSSD